VRATIRIPKRVEPAAVIGLYWSSGCAHRKRTMRHANLSDENFLWIVWGIRPVISYKNPGGKARKIPAEQTSGIALARHGKLDPAKPWTLVH